MDFLFLLLSGCVHLLEQRDCVTKISSLSKNTTISFLRNFEKEPPHSFQSELTVVTSRTMRRPLNSLNRYVAFPLVWIDDDNALLRPKTFNVYKHNDTTSTPNEQLKNNHKLPHVIVNSSIRGMFVFIILTPSAIHWKFFFFCGSPIPRLGKPLVVEQAISSQALFCPKSVLNRDLIPLSIQAICLPIVNHIAPGRGA